MHPPRGAGGPADGNAGGGAIPPDPGGVSNKRGSQQEGQAAGEADSRKSSQQERQAAGGAGSRRGRQQERQAAGEADSRRGTQESPPRSSKSRDEPPGNRRKSEPPDRSEGASCKKEPARSAPSDRRAGFPASPPEKAREHPSLLPQDRRRESGVAPPRPV